MKIFIRILYALLLLTACKSDGAKSKPSSENSEETSVRENASISNRTSMMPYFKANGEEPFWSLEIFDTQVVLKTISDSIQTPHTEPELAQDNNVKRYHIETEAHEMIIQITQTECVNTMYGNQNPYSVSVNFKNTADARFQNLKGCGFYVTDYRLHDIWVLEQLNGDTITTEDFSKELPLIEIKTAENTFMGFAGCNQMNGDLFFEKNLLRFTTIATTKILCESSKKEAEFIKALQSTTTYTIENNRLTLSNPSRILVVFRKID